MSLDEGNDGHGYVMSPHVAAMLESKKAGEATVRAFIADIFTQRIQSHHAEAMKGKRFAEHLERFIERAPQVIEVIVYTDEVEGFSIQQVQRITDDLVELEDSAFMARYGLEELFAALSEAEAAGELDPETPYQALAKHIDPVNPAAGALTIDRLILSAIRARDSHYNRQRAASFAGSFMVASGLASLGVSALLHAIGSATPLPLPTPPVAVALAILAIGLGLTWLSFRWRDKEPDPPLPATISAWLTENNHQNGLRYWHAVYWPTAKRLACERRVFGFSFPKKSPLSTAEQKSAMGRRKTRPSCYTPGGVA
ncbi:hypothetical protein [Novosphingobium decolorationis]|uniref:Uncharacterized protein n=1 Tax=Novosphingobium decolorationis TaxID=2698673 RepID=A0ABX8E7M5_9SPHN|nr:hypothetical protein [Novosphingobium decolorationis]QVM84066.1 hypothetical protein HT578_10535 [Novosphingobium decolorationis]